MSRAQREQDRGDAAQALTEQLDIQLRTMRTMQLWVAEQVHPSERDGILLAASVIDEAVKKLRPSRLALVRDDWRQGSNRPGPDRDG